jgi:hypothetical protein
MTEPARHISSFDLDALALDALDDATARTARTHLAACAACRGDADDAAALRAQFASSALSRQVPARATKRRVWVWLAAPMLAAAAAILIVATRPRHPDDTLGIKGDATWQVVANRGGDTFAVADGTQLRAGDRIRFVIIPNGARFVLVASIDGSGTASIYYPYAGSESAEVSGARVELPGSIVLDAAPGPERLFAVLSDRPVAADTVRGELAAIGSEPARIRATHRLNVDSRAQLSLVFEKVAP